MMNRPLIKGLLVCTGNCLMISSLKVIKTYEQFFEVKTTPKRGRKVTYKEDAIKEARRYLGYLALITNETI